MNSKLRMLAALALASAAATAAHAAGTAVNTMGAPYYDVSYEIYDKFRGVVSSDFVDNGSSTGGTLGLDAVIGSTWNNLPALQQAVVTNDGATYWARSTGRLLTTPPGIGTAIGAVTRVGVAQSFTKTSDAAQLRFTYTGGLLQSYRDPEFRPDCAGFTCTLAELEWDVSLWRNDTPTNPILMREAGFARLAAEDGVFRFSSSQYAENTNNPLWSWDCARCDLPAFGLAEATLRAPFVGIVDLSAIPFDPNLAQQPEFTVLFTLKAVASSETEWTGATAWARDPLDLGNDAGVGFTVFDLQPTNNPVAVVPEPATALLLTAGLWAVLARRRRS